MEKFESRMPFPQQQIPFSHSVTSFFFHIGNPAIEQGDSLTIFVNLQLDLVGKTWTK